MTDKIRIHQLQFFITLILVTAINFELLAQKQPVARPGDDLIHSHNGWQITANGTLKVLLLYVEIDYDVNPDMNPLSKGTADWPAGKLPVYANEVFDSEYLNVPMATMTRYYNDCSLGNFRVLGDYWFDIITLKESEVVNLNLTTIKRAVGKYIDDYGTLKTGNNSSFESFDQWTRNTKVGYERVNAPDDPISFDHVMMMLRNFHGLHRDNGSAAGSTFGKILGHDSDSFSQFGAGHAMPQNIMRHEFNHLLLGANNFHCCGGSSAAFVSYFLTTQFGWGLMGAANSSFNICNAWDRDRLDWRGKGKEHNISATSPDGLNELFADLDPHNAQQQGQYLLRDFATTGDAMRIKIPFIQEDQYPQYLWVENHQTRARNGVEFDEFMYQNQPNMTPATPGLYMYRQVAKSDKAGPKTYSGDADYLRFMPADGMYDIVWSNDSILLQWQTQYSPVLIKANSMQNPLTGTQDLEIIPFNKNPDDDVLAADDGIGFWGELTTTGKTPGGKQGHSRHAYTLKGNSEVSMGSNPSTASMLTHTTGPNLNRRADHRNNRAVLLNGIAINILEERSDGSILVDVRFNHTLIENKVRWCADSILLNPIARAEFDLELAVKKELIIDHGRTPTRNIDPVVRRGEKVFVDPTSFHVLPEAKVRLNKKSTITVDNKSKIVFYRGSTLNMDSKARIRLKNGSQLIFENGAQLIGSPKRIKKCKNCEVVFNN
jgi:hypothetical protein